MCIPEQWVCTVCGSVSDNKGDEGCSHCGGELRQDPPSDDGSIEVEAANDLIRVDLLEKYGYYLECPLCKNIYDPDEYSEGVSPR